MRIRDRWNVGCDVFKSNNILIKEAISAVLGVGKKREPENISPGGILFFALLVAIIFLGTVSLLMFIVSILIK